MQTYSAYTFENSTPPSLRAQRGNPGVDIQLDIEPGLPRCARNDRVRTIGIIFLFFILLLAGCASKPVGTPLSTESSPEQAWSDQQERMNQIRSWEVEGKFSIKQPEHSGSASLNWRQSHPKRYEIALTGPLGQGSILLSGYPNHVILNDAKGRTKIAKNAQKLLYQHTGWTLPVESLYYWVRGLPDPHYSYQYRLNEFGQLAGLQQHGWTLAYDTYQQYDDYFVPRKITLNYPATRITLLLRSWQVNLPTSD